MGKMALLFFILVLMASLGLTTCDSGGGDDDNAGGDDDAGDDDTQDDDLDDDDSDDDADDDADDDSDDDGSEQVFSFDPFAACSGPTCEMVAYASISQVFQVQQFSDAALGVNDWIVIWAFGGDTEAGDVIDLTFEGDANADDDEPEPIDAFVMVLQNAKITLAGIDSERAFFSTSGAMQIDAIGTQTGDLFQGRLENVGFHESEIDWSTGVVEVNLEGDTGLIVSDPVDGLVISVPQ